MDPLSIAAGATALATFAFRASHSIYNCVEDLKSADSTLLQMKGEVDALASGLESIASTFQSDNVIQFCSQTGSTQSGSVKLLVSVKPLLADCEKTLKRLGEVIEGIEGKSGRVKLLQRSIKALQTNLKSKEIEFIRHQIRSYSSAMQLTLHMVGISILVDSNKQAETTGAKLNQQLTKLAAQITDVQKKVTDTNATQVPDDEVTSLDEEENEQQKQHIEDCIQSAKIIFSNATIYSGSVSGTVVGDSDDVANLSGTFGSVLGLNDGQRRRINQWLPSDGVEEENGTEEEEDDDDDEVESSLFKARLAVAQKKLANKNYKAAESQYRTCLENSTAMKKLPDHEVVDLKLEYAAACRGSGNADEQQKILLGLLKLELPNLQRAHLDHSLAVAYLDDQRLDLAQKHAEKAMLGRKKILGHRNESYHESLSLLAEICTALGNTDDAEVYRHMLPADFRPPAESSNPAAPSNDLVSIKLLSSNGYDIHNKSTYFDALSWASNENNEAVVRLLLERGSDVSGKDQRGNTMLIYAAEFGFADLVSSLITKGSDVNAVSSGGTPLYHGIKYADVVSILISNGADVNGKDKSGDPALVSFAMSGKLAEVERLLDLGANIEARGSVGFTALKRAVLAGHEPVVRLLLDRGANVNTASDVQSTPLQDAARLGRESILRLLLERGADVRAKDSKKRTALDWAKQGNNAEIVRLLKAQRGGIFKR